MVFSHYVSLHQFRYNLSELKFNRSAGEKWTDRPAGRQRQTRGQHNLATCYPVLLRLLRFLQLK